MGSLVIFVLVVALLQCAVTVTVVAKRSNERPRWRNLSPIPELVNTKSAHNLKYVTDEVPFFDFNAAVYHKGTFLCGGVLISEDKVLTAAECVHPYIYERPLHAYVELGGMKINSGPEQFKITVPVHEIVIHPDFRRHKRRAEVCYNNVALLKLKFKATLTKGVRPITLPTADDVIVPGKTGTLTGWGGESNLKPTTELQGAYNSVIMEHQACCFSMGMAVDANSFCTVPSNKTTGCKYDQGSPFFKFGIDGGKVLLGIVNYGSCDMTYPTIYTNVPKYVPWIHSIA